MSELARPFNGVREPLAFFSTEFRLAQTGYTAYDGELLAVYLFRQMLKRLDLEFSQITSHLPSSSITTSTKLLHARQRDFIARFSTDIQNFAEKDNIMADRLSSIEEMSTSVDYATIA